MNQPFAAIDVETANPDLASICQIGVVRFAADGSQQRWQSLINPQDHFHPANVAIHGIDESMVADAPTFDQVRNALDALENSVVVSHTTFDRVAIERAADRYGVARMNCEWLDSARVVRRAWPDRYARRGYGLANVANDLGIEYRPHEAVEDAWAAGMVMLRVIEETGLSLQDWALRALRPIAAAADSAVEPDPDGPLYGEVVCFTGTLSIPRRRAATLAAAAGCVVSGGVTSETTVLVVGDQDIRKLAGHGLSSKHRKALRQIAKGQPIRILGEGDFHRVIAAEGGTGLPSP